MLHAWDRTELFGSYDSRYEIVGKPYEFGIEKLEFFRTVGVLIFHILTYTYRIIKRASISAVFDYFTIIKFFYILKFIQLKYITLKVVDDLFQ